MTKILFELVDTIKTITINNPKAKNAISPEDSAQLGKIINESLEDGTRVIILTGAEGNFCSGADLVSTLQKGADFSVPTYLREIVNPIILQMRNTNIPIIAKVRGVSAGLGANFALACDMVYANTTAYFSQIFTNIALSSDGGGAYFMPQAIGYKKAFELMTTATKLPAQEAVALGLINYALPDEELDQAVQEMATRLATGAYIAIQHTKANLREGITGTLASTLELEAYHQGLNGKTSDFTEGLSAFFQKRKPNYTGK